MNLAPIALFVYNRFEHTQQTIDALVQNHEASMSDLVIFSDAPKTAEQEAGVTSVRKYIHELKGFKSITIIEQEKNLGLSSSIISGVTSVIEKYGRIIVLEDDIIVSPYFLDYMNRALDKYESDERVASIHAYVYPYTGVRAPLFFLKGADCWGWATWKRGWDLFERDGQKLQQTLQERGLVSEFNFDNEYPYYQMLVDQVHGKNQSWAIRWYASAFLAGKLTLYPGKAMIFNTGMDNSGTHCVDTDNYNSEMNRERIKDFDLDVAVNNEARETFKTFFKNTRQPEVKITLMDKVIMKLKAVYRGIKGGNAA